jgi:hypothetical protein
MGIGPVDGGESGEAAEEPDAGEAAEESGGARATAGTGGRSSGRSRRRGGLGRFRRGREAAGDEEDSGDGDAEDSAVPGPAADAGASGNGDGAAPAGSRDTEAADEGGPSTDASPAPETGPGGGGRPAAADLPPVPEEAEDDPVGYMVGNYPGVGRKTAEKLVEAFGESVFRVIDQDPGRLTNVLPEHRAQAVIQARQADRERAGT